jgi:hypothetical protein
LNSKTFDLSERTRGFAFSESVAAGQPTATAPQTPGSIRLTGGPDEAWRVGRGQSAFIAHNVSAALSTDVARADRSRSGR